MEAKEREAGGEREGRQKERERERRNEVRQKEGREVKKFNYRLFQTVNISTNWKENEILQIRRNFPKTENLFPEYSGLFFNYSDFFKYSVFLTSFCFFWHEYLLEDFFNALQYTDQRGTKMDRKYCKEKKTTVKKRTASFLPHRFQWLKVSKKRHKFPPNT